MRDYAWLLVGGAAALFLPASGIANRLGGALGTLVPLPWAAIGVGILVFAAFSALHFRMQLVRSLECRSGDLERQAAASRLVNTAASDGRRWLRVVQENLEMVADDTQAARERDLYLGGARANADKLEQAFERIEGCHRPRGEVES